MVIIILLLFHIIRIGTTIEVASQVSDVLVDPRVDPSVVNVTLHSTTFKGEGRVLLSVTDSISEHDWITSHDHPVDRIGRIAIYTYSSLFLRGNLLYIADSGNGIFIYDIQTRTQPVLVSFTKLDGVRDIFVTEEQDYAYVVGSFAIKIFNVTDATEPLLVYSHDFIISYESVYVANDFLYVLAGANVRILCYELFDPILPKNGRFISGDRPTDMVTDGFVGYVADWDYLRIVDLRGSPTLETFSTYPTYRARGVKIRGNVAFISDDREGLRVVDVSDPENPGPELGRCDTSQAFKSDFLGDDFMVVADLGSGIRTIDISNYGMMPLRGRVSTNYARDVVVVDDRYAFVADSAAGLTVVDVGDPYNPALVMSTREDALENAQDMECIETDGGKIYCYLVDRDAYKIIVIDCTDPTDPVIMNRIETYPAYMFQILLHQEALYVVSMFHGMIIFDLSTPEKINPPLIQYFETGVGAKSMVIAQNFAYVTYDGYYTDHVVKVFDVSDPFSPVLASRVENITFVNPFDIFSNGDDLLIIHFSDGIPIYDISKNRTHPTLITESLSSLIDYANNILFLEDNEIMYVADRGEGLKVINMSIVAQPEIIHILDFDGEGIARISVSDDILVVALFYSMQLYDISTYDQRIRPRDLLSRTYSEDDTFYYCEYLRVIGNVVFGCDHLDGFFAYRFGDIVLSLDLGSGGDDEHSKNIVCSNLTITIEGEDFNRDTIQDTFKIVIRDLCPPFGVCNPESFNCSCLSSEYTGSDCGNYDCFGTPATSKLVCSSHGVCIEQGKCACDEPENPDDRCISWYCHGVPYFRDEVCKGHGKCVTTDTCQCDPGYNSVEGVHGNCTEFYCGQYYKTSKDACHKRGKCVSSHKCICSYDYEGDLCEDWKCQTIQKDSPNVCSGRGECASPDICECNRGYVGKECKTNIYLSTVMAPILSMSSLLVVVLFSCVCCSLVQAGFCLLSFLLTLLFVGMGTSGGIVINQRRGIEKFLQLKNFDLLMREQEMEENEGGQSLIASLKIDEKLFEIPFDEIDVKRILGEGGSNSVVFLAIWLGKEVAFKCFKTRMVCATQSQFNEFEKEVRVMASMSHPNVIRFFGASLKHPRVGIVMEYCENGELLPFFWKKEQVNGETYPIEEKIRMMGEISRSLEYLHSRNIIHRDLKSENVLVNKNEKCKLMDFGLSRIIQSMSVTKTTRIGTCEYMAPEILNNKYYDEKCDVFSFGILMFVILTQELHPYGTEAEKIEFKVAQDENYRPVIQNIVPLLAPGKESIGRENKYYFLIELMTTSWKMDKNERKSFHQLSKIFEEEQEKMKGKLVHVESVSFQLEEQEINVQKKNEEEEDEEEEEEEENQEKERLLIEELRSENDHLFQELEDMIERKEKLSERDPNELEKLEGERQKLETLVSFLRKKVDDLKNKSSSHGKKKRKKRKIDMM